MVVIDPNTGYDITPSTTGFFSVIAQSQLPFNLRSYSCGTNIFNDILRGTYANMPYYVSSGECIQLYNPSNISSSVDWSISTNSPATTLVVVSLVLWFMLLGITYFGILGGALVVTNCVRDKIVHRKIEMVEVKAEEKTSAPVLALPPPYSATAPYESVASYSV